VAARYPQLAAALAQQVRDANRLTTESPQRTVRWRAAGWLLDHPWLHHAYRRASTGHRSLSGSRMAEIYGVAPLGLPLAAARARHGLRYVQHRLALPAQRRPSRAFDFAEAILCINLDRDTGRWQQMRERFRRLGITDRVERLPAIATPDNHHRGCAWSWRSALQLALDRGYESVLVLEDDAVFLDTTEELLGQVNRDLRGQSWDLLYLGAAAWCELFAFLPGSRVLQVCHRGVTSSHALAVHRRAIPRILADIPGPDRPEAMRTWLDEWLAIDQYFYRQVEAGTLRALITWPRVASQPPLLRYPDGDLIFADRYVI
jgi:hypothetical protein